MQSQLTKLIGDRGEQAVVDYLQQQGYTICARNFRITAGEVDIIARKDEVIAFVEVKARSTAYFPLSEIIVPAKQRKIVRAARQYIFRHNLTGVVYRFDVALLLLAGDRWDIQYIRDAFTDTGSFI